MLLVTGEIERITDRKAGNPGNEWTEHTLVVRDWGQTLYVTASRELVESGLPKVGEKVALDVSVRAYVNREQKAGHGFTAFRRNAEAEAQLFGDSKAAPLRAAQ